MIGTPAEEGGGGKVDLLREGAFEGVDAAMMSHPFNLNIHNVQNFALAAQTVFARYKGKASHASGFPWEGVNALDAAVMAYQSISCLRQQMKPTWRVHFVFNKGGTKPNIIPEETELEGIVRAPTMGELAVLKKKIANCFESAAMATGCSVDIEWNDKPYENILSNYTLGEVYAANAEQVGIELESDVSKLPSGGSTDMGNVSHVVPSIHPMFYIGSPEVPHTRLFANATGSKDAQVYAIRQAKALALTAIDVYCKPELLEKMQKEFKEDLRIDSLP